MTSASRFVGNMPVRQSPPLVDPRIKVLTDTIADLRARVEDLETLLHLKEPLPNDMLSGPSKARIAVVLNLFDRREYVTYATVTLALSTTEAAAKIYVTHARKALAKICPEVKIKTMWGRGWTMSQSHRALLRRAMKREAQE